MASRQKKVLFLLSLVMLGALLVIGLATEATLNITAKNALTRFGQDRALLAKAAAGSLQDFLSLRLKLFQDDYNAQTKEGVAAVELSQSLLKELHERAEGFLSVVAVCNRDGAIRITYPAESSLEGAAGLDPAELSGISAGQMRMVHLGAGRLGACIPIRSDDGANGYILAAVNNDSLTVFVKQLERRLEHETYLFDRDWSALIGPPERDDVAPSRRRATLFSRLVPSPTIQMDGFIPLEEVKPFAKTGQDQYLAYAPVKVAGEDLILGIATPRANVSGFLLWNPWVIIGLAATRILAVAACVTLFYLFDKRRLQAKEEASQLREEQKLLARLEESEERYRTLVENLLSPVLIFQDGHIKFANPMFYSLTQYTPEEVAGGRFDLLSLAHEDDRGLVQESVARLLDGERLPSPREIRYRKKNGDIIIGLTFSSMIHYDGKRAIETVVIDITRMKRIEQEFEQTKQRLQYLLDNAPIMILSLDNDGNFSYLNKEALNISGYRYDDWIGKPFAPIVHPDDLPLAVAKFEEGKKGVQRRDYKLRIRDSSGKERTLHLIADTICENDQIKGSLIIASDITEQQRLQQAINETRDHLANIIENAGDAIVTIDTIGNIVSWNKSAEVMFHFVSPYAFHKPLHLLLNMDAARTADMIRRVNNGETIRDAEVECLRNGSRLDTLFTLSPIRNASGKVIGISCFAKDITERRNFEKQLERDKSFIDRLIENASVLIAAVNEKGNIVIFNRRFEEVSGYTKEEAIGKDPLELLVPAENRSRIAELMAAIQTNKPPLELESPIRSKDGKTLVVSWNAAAMRLPSGHNGIVVVGQDITEHKRMQEELMQSKKLASIGELVSGVAHELNNPLTIIMGYSQLLVSESAILEKHRDMAQKVLDAAERSKRIVENLLAFARKKRLQKQELDINQVLEKTLMLREHTFSVNNVKVVRRFADNLPLVHADAHQLQQVFLNLINNAFDAMLQANGRGVLEVKTLRADGSIAVEIIDDGPGVPESIHEKIFDPFFTTKEVGKGTGLGMSLSYGIVKEHGGKIYLDKTFRTGAKFVVEFPINYSSPALAQTCNSTVSPSANM